MKRLKLKAFELEGAEILTRNQLKKVLGGDGSGTGGTSETSGETTAESCSGYCRVNEDCSSGCICTAYAISDDQSIVATCSADT